MAAWSSLLVAAAFALVLLSCVNGQDFATGLKFPASGALLANPAFFARYGSVVPPDEFDWRPTGFIRAPVNQLSCGTCYVHAVVHGVEALHAIKNGSASPANTSAAVLPEDQVIRCGGAAVVGTACEGGWVGESYIYAAITGLLNSPDWGAALADPTLNNGGNGQQCPFIPPSLLPSVDGTTPLSLPEYFRRRGIRIYGWETVPATEGALLQALSNQPVVALVHASRDWFSYRGGLYGGSCSSAPNTANHAVLVVGYTPTAWIVKNSWGTGWGDGGYMLLTRGGRRGNPCGLLNMATYPVLEPTPAARRGELLQEGFCSGLLSVDAAGAAAGVTLRSLAEQQKVPVEEMVRVNTHLKNADLPLEAGTRYYLPPCSRNTPPPPVPTAECGTLYRVSLVGSPNSSAGVVSRNLFAESGEHGRRLQREHFHAHHYHRHHHHGRNGQHPHPRQHPHQHQHSLLREAGGEQVQAQAMLRDGPVRRSLAVTGPGSDWVYLTLQSSVDSVQQPQQVLEMELPDYSGGNVAFSPKYGENNGRQLWRLVQPEGSSRTLLQVQATGRCARSEPTNVAQSGNVVGIWYACDPADARQWVELRDGATGGPPSPSTTSYMLAFTALNQCLYGNYLNYLGLRYLPYLADCAAIRDDQRVVLATPPVPPADFTPAWLTGSPVGATGSVADSAPRAVRLANGAFLTRKEDGSSTFLQIGFGNVGPEGLLPTQLWRLFRGPVDGQGRQMFMLGANVTVKGPDGKNTSLLLCLAPSQDSAYERLYTYANCEPGSGGWVGLHHFGVAAAPPGSGNGSGGSVRVDARGYPVGGALLWGFLRNQANCVYTPQAHEPFDPAVTDFLQRPYTEPCLPDNPFQQYELVDPTSTEDTTPRPPRPPVVIMPGSALRYVLDSRGTYLSAPAARVGAPVGFLAAASAADQSPDPSQLWYLRPVADGPAGAKRYQLALAAGGQQLCATVAAGVDSLALQECDAGWSRQAFAFPGADNLGSSGSSGSNALPVGRLPYLVYTSDPGAGGSGSSGKSYCVTGAAYQPDFGYARARVASVAQCEADSRYTSGLFVGKPLLAYAGLAAPLVPLPATSPPRSRAGYVAIYDVRGAALSAAASGAVTLRYTESGAGGGSGPAAKQALQDSQLWRVRPAASSPGADWFTATNYVFGDSLCLSTAAAVGATDALGPLTLRPCDASDVRQRLVFRTAAGQRSATRTVPLGRTQLGFADAGSPCLASVTPGLAIAYRAPFEAQALAQCGARTDEAQLFEVADPSGTATYQHLRWWNGGGPSQTTSVAGSKPQESSCPAGTYVAGLEGVLWTGLPALEACVFAALLAESPLGGMLYSNLANELNTWDVRQQQQLGFALSFNLLCNDGTKVTVNASPEWSTNDATAYRWSETCPGGYDRVRAGTRPFLYEGRTGYFSSQDIGKLDFSFRCRSDRRWTLYTVNGAGVSKRLATYNSTSGDGSRLLPNAALVARLKQTCGPAGAIKTATDTTVTFYESPQTPVDMPTTEQVSQLNLATLHAMAYRSLPQLLDLQSLPPHRLENMAGAAACPDNQVLTGVYTRSSTPALGSTAPYNGWQAGRVVDLPVSLYLYPGTPLLLAIDGVVCRAVLGSEGLPPVTSAGPGVVVPPPAGMVHLVSAEPAAGSGGSGRRTKDLGCAGDGAFITGVYAADDQIDVNVLGVRCSDGSSAFIGTQRREAGAPLPAYIDVPCAEGFDAVKKPWGTPSDGRSTSRGLGSFALRCSSAAGQYASFAGSAGDGRFWTQMGAYKAVLARGDLYAASEAFVNSEDVYGCSDAGSVITQITVVYDDAARAVNTLHFFCGERPRLSADSSFYDIAFRYGITLSDLFGANPGVNSSLPLAAYNNTVLAVPQLCGSISQQPPITTIASSCPRYWPLPNITVTGAETCGSIAIAFCNRDLRFLNSVNNGICPNATVRITRGVRLCIPPRASVSSVGHRRQLMQAALAAGGAEGAQQAALPRPQLQEDWPMAARRRGLLQSDDAPRAASVGAVCTAKVYVSVGASCGSIAAAYNLTDMQIYDFNPDLRCEALAAGSALCVERSDSGVEDSLEPILVEDLPPPPPPPPSPKPPAASSPTPKPGGKKKPPPPGASRPPRPPPKPPVRKSPKPKKTPPSSG